MFFLLSRFLSNMKPTYMFGVMSMGKSVKELPDYWY